MGARKVGTGVAFLAVIALALFVVARASSNDTHDAPSSVQLPDRPPTLTGTAYGTILTSECAPFCANGAGRMPVASPASLRLLAKDVEVGDIAPAPSRDALLLLGDQVVNAQTGATVYGTVGIVGTAFAMDAFGDGRLVIGVRDDDDTSHVEIVDPATGSRRTYVFDGFVHSVAAGSGGRVAVLSCCSGERNTITVIEPSGGRRRFAVALAPPNWAPLNPLIGHPKLTWGESGLFAISSSYPFVTTNARTAPFGAWTMVVDDRGRHVATLGGWQGLAWSPDGLGLLGGYKLHGRGKDQRFVVEVRYGPGLRHRKRVGVAPFPIDLSVWTR